VVVSRPVVRLKTPTALRAPGSRPSVPTRSHDACRSPFLPPQHRMVRRDPRRRSRLLCFASRSWLFTGLHPPRELGLHICQARMVSTCPTTKNQVEGSSINVCELSAQVYRLGRPVTPGKEEAWMFVILTAAPHALDTCAVGGVTCRVYCTCLCQSGQWKCNLWGESV
jgi:hypothetical protein